MNLFLTGATGYLGGYLVDRLLTDTDTRLTLLVRGKDVPTAEEKLWRAFQLHMDGPRFFEALERCRIVLGDLSEPNLGLTDAERRRIVRESESIIHAAAALNRVSERLCMNVNLKGTLSVVKLARDIESTNGLRRFSFLSAIAVAGERRDQVVTEDEAIDFRLRDYDPYARTKKFGEHMVRELLPDVPLTIFRPPTTLGDSRFPETTQFDMVRATCALADMTFVPIREHARIDIAPADFVSRCIATLHMKDRTDHDCYHLSAGVASKTAGEIAEAVFAEGSGNKGRPPRFLPGMEGPFEALVNQVSRTRSLGAASHLATLLKTFLPYITRDTVFDNTRVTTELGIQPTAVTEYIAPLYAYGKRVRFAYPYKPMPTRPTRVTPSRASEVRA